MMTNLTDHDHDVDGIKVSLLLELLNVEMLILFSIESSPTRQ